MLKTALILMALANQIIATSVEAQQKQLTPLRTELNWAGWAIKINQIYFTDTVEAFRREIADEDSVFVYLDLTVQNNSNEGARFIPQNDLKIAIGDKVFDAADLEDYSKGISYTGNIEPTLVRNRKCYFELPQALLKDSFILQFSGGLLSGPTEVNVSIATPAPTPDPTPRSEVTAVSATPTPSDQEAQVAVSQAPTDSPIEGHSYKVVNGKLVDTTVLASPTRPSSDDTGLVTKATSPNQKASPNAVKSARLTILRNKVGLTADQEAEAKAIIDKYVDARQAANGNHARLVALKVNFDGDIDAILTSDQGKRWDAYRRASQPKK
jgi:hypothetical protein